MAHAQSWTPDPTPAPYLPALPAGLGWSWRGPVAWQVLLSCTWGTGQGQCPRGNTCQVLWGAVDVQEAKRAWGHRTLVLGGLRAHLSPLGSLPKLWALELSWRAGGGNPHTNVLNLKTAGKAERAMGREGRGEGPLWTQGACSGRCAWLQLHWGTVTLKHAVVRPLCVSG